MKDKSKKSRGVFKGLIKTGGEVADKMLDKGADVAADMMKHMSGLIAKLSDDIGLMANRILTMEERIGRMADRIVETEELVAQMTAVLANKELKNSAVKSAQSRIQKAAVLDVTAPEASLNRGPELRISGDPEDYLLLVSSGPLFLDGSTVVSHINATNAYAAAWRRSIDALKDQMSDRTQYKAGTLTVSMAIKTVGENNQLSALSNSVDVVVYDADLVSDTAS